MTEPTSPRPNGAAPWWARFGDVLLTERGLATLLTLVLVGFLVWGGWRLISDVREVGSLQVAQQERILTRLDDAVEHLERIEALLRSIDTRQRTQSLGDRLDNAQLQMTGIDAQLDRMEGVLQRVATGQR